MATLQSVVKDKYVKRFKGMQETIIDGTPRDYVEYRYCIGYLKGMWDLMEEIYPLMKDPDEMPEEGDQ